MIDKSVIKVSELSAGYRGGANAISDVTFRLASGQLVGILGPNGGGKTTLFRALLGELPFCSGAIKIAGKAAYVPQTNRSRLDFPVNAFDVALMGAYARTPWYRRVSNKDRELARYALERMGLREHASLHFGALSGGQRQRVLIARALVQDTAVLLLDEPLSGVDVASAEKIEAVFTELRAEGRTLLIASHDIHQVRQFDKVLCLNRKQIAFGEPNEVLTNGVLKETYGSELIFLDKGATAIAVQHHEH